ncbi:putative U-box domain-containing protein 50 isoform X1 [Trifolium pratense]|uniref:putative U-box domain-containing protein 50 isoform X1 n=1 Tax=Trifolium pratense TaxID=57577 RepID=UPI001E696AD0|nr:putative U-box domain-containing protein 50 isoform X1 [Trifolium pratense]
MDATQKEKIYVAVGDDAQDGFNTLNWALKKWNSHPISIVILHVTHNISKDYVYTPFGKLPARSLNDEKLEALRKDEKERIKKLFSKYIAFCGKVSAEIHELEKLDEPMQKRIIDLIIGLGITKLVMGFSFMKPSLKSKGAISGLFYVHQHKPSLCELFIICGGKQVFLRGNNDEKIMEDDSGVMVAKMRDKVTFKDWLDKMFSDKTNDYSQNRLSASPSIINLVQNQWEFYLQDIENYYQELLSSNLEEGSYVQDNDNSHISPIEPHVTELNNSNKNTTGKIEIMKNKLNEAHKTIELKRKETKENIERRTKAEWAISLCNSRAEEIEGRIREEVSTKEGIKKELQLEKDQREEMTIEIEERKRRMSSLVELQSELSNKLQISTIARSRAETQVERAVRERAEMVREIEELRKQRDVLNRRIEFCKQKDAIGMAARLSDNGASFEMREYSEVELRLATDNFSERLRLKSGGDWSNVYRGRFNHSSVAIKLLPSFASLSREDFQSKMRFLGDIRQPHLVAMVGFCSEPKCIILEYMGNGSLQDMLFSRRRNRGLRWHDRIRIATEVCSGLGFLNSSQQRPILHCHVNPAHILLDRNLVAKITGFGLQDCDDKECNVESDLRSVGILLMQLLTGRNWAGPIEEPITMDRETLVNVLDDMAGQWPLDLAKEIVNLAMICMSVKSKPSLNLSIARVLEELNKIRRKGDEIVAKEDRKVIIGGCIDREGSSDVPSVFLCPILQEVMKNPHVAADGFSYELEAIEQWLHSGHDTSPMTNLRLKHTLLTPNYTLRSFLEEWQTKQSTQIAN